MEIKIRKKKEHLFEARHTTPITRIMKEKMALLTDKKKIDFCEMVREFLEEAIEKCDQESAA